MYKLLPVFMLCFVSLYGHSQTKLPKKTNVITIHVQDSAEVALVNFAKHLQKNGYTIERMDKELGSLSTDFKSFKWQTGGNVKVSAYVEQLSDGSKLVLRGKAYNTGAGKDYEAEACQCGLAGDLRIAALRQIMEVAQAFGGTVGFLTD